VERDVELALVLRVGIIVADQVGEPVILSGRVLFCPEGKTCVVDVSAQV